MGEIQVGDRVVGSDGKAHRVTGVYPQGEREVFRVIFSLRGMDIVIGQPDNA